MASEKATQLARGLCVCVYVTICLAQSTRAPVEMSHEKRLIRDLISNYKEMGIMGRPVKDQNDTITIKYGLSLIQILDLDERNQILTTNVWATYNWNDMYLRWDKEEYGNITTVRVRNEDIWKPDIKLYNYADTRLSELRDALCVISDNGDVVWIPQAIFKSSCSIDITHFPFDEQSCHLKFGSWTYDGSKLDLQFVYGPKFELTDYVKSNEWDIIKSSAKRTVKYYPCCPEPYVDLQFFLRMRRLTAFYNYILILPCVLLSSLTLVLFWLPPESPAKMQLGMNIFVAFFVLLLLLAESTPPAAASIPLIGAYYCLNMILITLSTLLAVIVVNLYFHGPKTSVPRLFKKLMLDVFARIFCMRAMLLGKAEKAPPGGGTYRRHQDVKYDRVGMVEMQGETPWPHPGAGSGGQFPHAGPALPGLAPLVGSSCNGNPALLPPCPDTEGLGGETLATLPSQCSAMEWEVREIRRQLRSMGERAAERDDTERRAREWKVVALALDRVFFFFYLAVLLLSAGFLFFHKYFDGQQSAISQTLSDAEDLDQT